MGAVSVAVKVAFTSGVVTPDGTALEFTVLSVDTAVPGRPSVAVQPGNGFVLRPIHTEKGCEPGGLLARLGNGKAYVSMMYAVTP